MSLTVGTAGHIDHGKTWLVRSLTGKDTDRLPEERRRGISIELGYAPLELPDGRVLSLIDVPGHERFVRTMVAGATGIDLFLLVVDAGEGPRAQTHEHLAILRLLGVERGVVAVTKADSVDRTTLTAALEQAAELVPGIAVLPVSAKTGAGLPELVGALAALADTRPVRPAPTRLFIDRSFTLRGIGTVVTGTLWSGSIGRGDVLRAEPGGLEVRVRSVQVHDRPIERATAGRRVAVGLPGAERTQLSRGRALVEPGGYPVAYRLDVQLVELEPIAQGAHVQVHHGTTETPARVARVGDRFAQLRLAEPVVAARGDRVVIRDGRTIGGGRVLDPAPPRRTHPARLELLASGDPAAIARAAVRAPVRAADLAARGLLFGDELELGLAALMSADDWVFAGDWLAEERDAVHEQLREHARRSPLDPGLPLAQLLPASWSAAILPLLDVERRGASIFLPGSVAMLGTRAEAATRLERELGEAGPTGARVADQELGAFLEREERLVRLGAGFAVSPAAYAQARRVVIDECERTGSIRLARFRDLLGVSRRSAQQLLERLDADGVTRRVGDTRVLRRSARASA